MAFNPNEPRDEHGRWANAAVKSAISKAKKAGPPIKSAARLTGKGVVKTFQVVGDVGAALGRAQSQLALAGVIGAGAAVGASKLHSKFKSAAGDHATHKPRPTSVPTVNGFRTGNRGDWWADLERRRIRDQIEAKGWKLNAAQYDRLMGVRKK